jgi:(S)-mandelate dehydrogenase
MKGVSSRAHNIFDLRAMARRPPPASNHGGRTLDGAMAPIEVLPDIVEAAGKHMTVLVDSGFRRGSDVVKAMALGASAVLIGRATLYGVAVDGEDGAGRTITIFREEIDRLLALLGCRSVAELSRTLVLPEPRHRSDWIESGSPQSAPG